MLSKLPPFPRAFWVLLALFFFNRIGASLIWPFVSLFIREQTGAPLTQIATLLSIQAFSSLICTLGISAFMDRFGRKNAMLVCISIFGLTVLLMSQATTLIQWALLIALYGITQPVFYIGTNAMTADLVEPEHRTDAYAIVRTVSNLSIALAPAIGGIFIAQSHLFAYFGSALINFALVIPVLLFIKETLVREPVVQEKDKTRGAGFGALLQDKRFMSLCAVYGILEVGVALVFNLLAVYIKENYGLAENQFGIVLSVNAAMVVCLQYGITRLTRRYPPFSVLSLGSLFYVMGLAGFGLSSLMPHFIISMVIMTIGELMVAPTATAQVANLAPSDMRARYMGLFSLLYTVGTGTGPVIGGYLSDTFAPSAIWFGGASAALVAMFCFVVMPRLWQMWSVQPSAVSEEDYVTQQTQN
jgi:predicted MFS family arabinose efflux permease